MPMPTPKPYDYITTPDGAHTTLPGSARSSSMPGRPRSPASTATSRP